MLGFAVLQACGNLTAGGFGEARVVANGGSVQHPEMVIPTVGTHIGFLDTEGNEFAAMVYERPMFGA